MQTRDGTWTGEVIIRRLSKTGITRILPILDAKMRHGGNRWGYRLHPGWTITSSGRTQNLIIFAKYGPVHGGRPYDLRRFVHNSLDAAGINAEFKLDGSWHYDARELETA